MNVVLVGFMGVGKTTIGTKLAKILHYNFIDIDAFIQEEQNTSISEIFNLYGENYFRKIEQKALHQVLNLDNYVIATGGGTPCFYNNIDLINKKAESIYVSMPAKAIYSRLINAKTSRPLVKNKSENDLLQYIETTLSYREKFYNKCKIHVNALSLNINELSQQIINKTTP